MKRSRENCLMITALVLMGLIELTAHAGFRVEGSQPQPVTNTIAPGQQREKPIQRRCAPAPYRFGEYQPARSYGRSGMRSANTKTVPSWQQTDIAAHEMKWTSVWSSATNDFWMFEYRPDTDVGGVSLEVGGGDFSGLEWNSIPGTPEGGFVLAVYEGIPPETLFKGSLPSFKTASYIKEWHKTGPIDLITTVKFRRPAKVFTIVLLGIDPGPNISVDIRLCRVRAFPTSSFTPKTKK